MTTEELLVSSLVPASPNRIFAAWMDERQHSAFTGGRAHIDPWVGGRFSAWDGYIFGNHLFLDTGRRIVMAWRTNDFPEEAPDSQVDVRFEPVAGGTKVSIHHTGIPAGQSAKYSEGWNTHYLEPMARFFAKPGAMKAAIRAAVKGGLLSQAALTPARPSAARGAHNVFASDAPPPFTGAPSPAPVSNAKLRLARLREERAARDAAAARALGGGAEPAQQLEPEPVGAPSPPASAATGGTKAKSARASAAEPQAEEPGASAAEPQPKKPKAAASKGKPQAKRAEPPSNGDSRAKPVAAKADAAEEAAVVTSKPVEKAKAKAKAGAPTKANGAKSAAKPAAKAGAQKTKAAPKKAAPKKAAPKKAAPKKAAPKKAAPKKKGAKAEAKPKKAPKEPAPKTPARAAKSTKVKKATKRR